MFFYNAQNETPFGFYKLFIETLFLPNVEFLSFAVAALQMAIGLALAFGAVSQLALLLGLFLNLNFIMAGVVNPSVFYIMIELVLLSGHAGAVIGVDAYLSKFISQPWLIAQTQASQNRTTLKFQFWRNTFLIGLILTISIVDFSYIKAFSPEASVEDPAMLLYILAMFTIMQLVICNLQIQHRLQRLPVQPGTIFRFEGVS